jgi:hypothetical protein
MFGPGRSRLDLNRQVAGERESTNFVPEPDMSSRFSGAAPGTSSRLRRRGWEALADFRDWQAYETSTEPLYGVQNRDVP